MQPHGHHPGAHRPLGVQHVEGVAEVGEELVGGVEPLRGREPHVVRVQGVGHDEVRASVFGVPVGQLVGVGIGVVEESPLLHHEAPGVGAVAPRVPAEGALAGDPRLDLDRGPQVLALGVGVDVLVVDPAPAVARDLPIRLAHRGHRLRVALERHRDPVHGDRHPHRHEDPVQAPEPGPAAVLVDGLHVHVAAAGKRSGAHDLGQERFRRGVPVEDAVLRPLFVIDDELHRDSGIVRPPRVRWIAAVASQVARVGRLVHRCAHSLPRPPETGVAEGGGHGTRGRPRVGRRRAADRNAASGRGRGASPHRCRRRRRTAAPRGRPCRRRPPETEAVTPWADRTRKPAGGAVPGGPGPGFGRGTLR